jgi:hypothetical protein
MFDIEMDFGPFLGLHQVEQGSKCELFIAIIIVEPVMHFE